MCGTARKERSSSLPFSLRCREYIIPPHILFIGCLSIGVTHRHAHSHTYSAMYIHISSFRKVVLNIVDDH